jgi:hypothetical protein
MMEKYKCPVKLKGSSKAGVTIHIDTLGEGSEPFDITLLVKKPKADEDAPRPVDKNEFTVAGKLTFKFEEKGYIELFAEGAGIIDDEKPGHWGEI